MTLKSTILCCALSSSLAACSGRTSEEIGEFGTALSGTQALFASAQAVRRTMDYQYRTSRDSYHFVLNQQSCVSARKIDEERTIYEKRLAVLDELDNHLKALERFTKPGENAANLALAIGAAKKVAELVDTKLPVSPALSLTLEAVQGVDEARRAARAQAIARDFHPVVVKAVATLQAGLLSINKDVNVTFKLWEECEWGKLREIRRRNEATLFEYERRFLAFADQRRALRASITGVTDSKAVIDKLDDEHEQIFKVDLQDVSAELTRVVERVNRVKALVNELDKSAG